ncbi:MAG TPA: hypothetical protein VF189_03155 [Patescibacteria group bacterium]
MIVFGRESIKSTAGEIKQNMGASPAYGYLAGMNFIRGSLFDGAGLALSSLAQHVDPHFATVMNSMQSNPSLTPGEVAVTLGLGALFAVGSISGIAGAIRGVESIVTSPMRKIRSLRRTAPIP